MRPGVNVVRIALERGAIARLCPLEFAALKINVAQLRVVIRFVGVMNLRFERFNAFACLRARQLEPARDIKPEARNSVRKYQHAPKSGKKNINIAHNHSRFSIACTIIQSWNRPTGINHTESNHSLTLNHWKRIEPVTHLIAWERCCKSETTFSTMHAG